MEIWPYLFVGKQNRINTERVVEIPLNKMSCLSRIFNLGQILPSFVWYAIIYVIRWYTNEKRHKYLLDHMAHATSFPNQEMLKKAYQMSMNL